MFQHVKDLQFDVQVTKPDPRFANLLLEQFGGGNGELKAAMQYFVQSFSVRHAYPQLYDLLMDVATEELSHLEIVGATITMLLDGINSELKNAAEGNWLTSLNDKTAKQELIHDAIANPHVFNLTGGGPELTDSRGVPWMGNYVNANGDPTVDLRSNIAAESRAKIVYEYLLQFTDDPGVQQTLQFLMTREIAHFQQFAAALETIQPNFPPGIMQGDARFTHTYFDMSHGGDRRGPWNEGQGPWPQGEQWEYVDDPVTHVSQMRGLSSKPATAAQRDPKKLQALEKTLGKERSTHIKSSVGKPPLRWVDPGH